MSYSLYDIDYIIYHRIHDETAMNNTDYILVVRMEYDFKEGWKKVMDMINQNYHKAGFFD